MAMGVVDTLEMVYVDHQQQGRFAGTRDHIDGAFQHGMEMAPVGQTRERVLERQFTQPVNHALDVSGGRSVEVGQGRGPAVLQQGTCITQAQIVDIHHGRCRCYR